MVSAGYQEGFNNVPEQNALHINYLNAEVIIKDMLALKGITVFFSIRFL